MNINKRSHRIETYVLAALSKIEKNPEISNSAALSLAVNLRFPKEERSKIIAEIKRRRPPRKTQMQILLQNKKDAKSHAYHQERMLGEDF